MTAVSGWGYESWGAGIFWVMAGMAAIALLIKLDEPKSLSIHRDEIL